MLGCRTRPNQALDFFVGQFDPGTLVMEGFRPKMFLFYREMFFFFFREHILCVNQESKSPCEPSYSTWVL